MEDYKIERTRREIPLIPLRGLSIFPYMVIHFDVGRKKSIAAIEQAMMTDSLIFLTSQKELKVEDPTKEDFYEVGTICKVKQMLRLPGDNLRVLVEGMKRAEVTEFIDEEEYFNVVVDEIEIIEPKEVNPEVEALMRMVMDTFEDYITASNKITTDVLLTVSEIDEPERMADVIASYIYLKPESKQTILETFDPYERLEKMNYILREELEVLQIEEEINNKVKTQINKVQKEYYLKEQIKAIQQELGDEMSIENEVDDYLDKIKKAKMPKEVKTKAEKEVNRLRRLSPSSAETGVIRNYIEWLVELPWNKKSKDRSDLKISREILDEDHYGLKDVKERILEYLAIRTIAKDLKAPILCLVGPPGVGKTSIARSIARSLNREFVRMSLGGVRDEAEIRGHRRTYVGAIPGRIIDNMKKVGVKNPVFLLDEIDKLNSDFRGDPASALLEVLDPEQNNTFTDHFLEVPFDLSKVMFITTANSVSTIPAPLLDRMELIQVSSYTEDEKFQIAKRYLVPKQIKEHGLLDYDVKISDNSIKETISSYTREAGVRRLERTIGSLCRKSAKRIVEEKVKSIRINTGNLKSYLGAPKYQYDNINKKNEIGMVTGLAWTSVGGVTLNIEVNLMPGKGKVQLTGKLGDVMKESAMIGISYIRSKSEDYGIDPKFNESTDIHIHIPEGATPKDGPSAGITMITALVSAFTKIAVKSDVAMTGEVTLRGKVLPIGGLKEKTIAAHRAGIKKVLVPFENKKDMEEVPAKVKKELEFVFVENMDQVLEHALESKPKKKRKTAKKEEK